ncbi:MAG: IMP dehydrogenase [Desulfurococcaceae archaeon]
MAFKDKLLNAVKIPDFNEVYILPSLAPVEPGAVDLTTKLTTNITLKIPLVSSPMDTVTELDMAVAMALLGGIGIVHRNMEREKQVEIVKKVKEHPPVKLRLLYLESNDTCGKALEVLKRTGIRNIPVVEGGVFLGYASVDLLRQCNPLEPVRHAVRPGKGYSVEMVKEAVESALRGVYDAIAVITRDSLYLGTLVYIDVLEDITPALDHEGKLLVGAAISPFDIERAKMLDKHVDVLVSDVAHFHNMEVLTSAKKLVAEISTDFVAGNIGSEEAVKDTITVIEEVSGFRVGIGGGSICTTPEVTGAYAPTLWAVASVRDALEELGLDVPIIADGGIRTAGDVVKALAAGANTVMLGYMLAGTDEAASPLIAIGNEYYKLYRGMASRGAIERRFAVDRYARTGKRVPEGVEGLVPYKGSIYNVVRGLVEAVRAGLGYAGARNIKELWVKARFISSRRGERGIIYRALGE